MTNKASWETINESEITCTVRMITPQGWVVLSAIKTEPSSACMTFVPDPHHEWLP